MAEPFLPLAGVSVLAWEQAVALPMATRLLADLGATVIRLESHTRSAQRARYLGNDLARNKQSVAVDLRQERGRRLVRELIGTVDVFCENFTPRVQRQFGLTYEELSTERPDLIMLSLTGYGQSGAWSDRPTYGPGIESAAGHALSMGYTDAPPTRPGTIVYADNVSGFYAALAILGALHRRRTMGTGAHIDLSMYEANAFHLGLSLVRSSLTGEPEQRRGNGDPAAWFQEVLLSCDPERWLAVTVRPEEIATLATLISAATDGDVLVAALRAWAVERTAEESAAALQAAGIAASPVQTAKDVLLNPQLIHREAFSLVAHDAPVNGYAVHPHLASPWRVAGRSRPPLREAPAVGQDTRVVLTSRLGLDDAAVDALAAGGVVGEATGEARPISARPAGSSIAKRLGWRLIAGYDDDPGAVLGLPDGGGAVGDTERGARDQRKSGNRPDLPHPMRVLDVSRGVAGCYAAQMLVFAGAEVLHVDASYPTLPSLEVDDQVRAYLHRGKAMMPMDLDTPEGREAFFALLRGCDALVEDLGPGGLEALELDEATLRGERSELVICRVSEFGADGPLADWSGSELVNLAAGGMLFLTGSHERPPVQLAPYQAQLTAGLLAAVAALAALEGGEPVTLDLSKQECVASLITPELTQYTYTGAIPAREGKVASMARIEGAKDTWVYAGPGAAANADYQTYARFLEIPELAEERFATADGRMEHWQEHQALLLPRLREKTAREWTDAAAAWRLTFGLTQSTLDLLECEQLAARGLFAPMPELGDGAVAPLAPFLVDGRRPTNRPIKQGVSGAEPPSGGGWGTARVPQFQEKEPAMDLPPLNETNCPPGTPLRPHEVTYTEEEIETYGERTGERAAEYRVDGVQRVPPGLLLVQPMRLIHNNFHYETGVHVSSDLTVQDLPPAGETVTIGGSVVDLFERNGSKYITFRAEVTGADGRALATIDHTSIYALAPR